MPSPTGPTWRRRAPGALSLAAVLAASLVAPAATLAGAGGITPVLDTITLAEDAAPATGNVLANDTDAEGDPLTVTSVDGVALGTLVIEPDGDYTFTPDPNENGAATAWYYVSDGFGDPVAAQVDITVTAVPDAPVAVDDTVTGTEDTVLMMSTLLANDTDADGNTLSINFISNPSGGTFSWINGTTIRFTPPGNACGEGVAGVDYQMNDGTARFDTGHVTVDLTCVNDAPVAGDLEVAGDEDADPPIAGTLTDAASDVDGDTLTFEVVDSPASGVLGLGTDGDWTYTPDADWSGSDGFTYTASDGVLGTGIGTVTITVGAVNDAPVAIDDAATAAESGPAVDIDVLANDTDVDDVELSVSGVGAVSPAGAGTATVVGGQVRFTPAALFDGTATMDYTVSDGELDDTGTITITVAADAVAPVVSSLGVTFGTGRVNESVPVRISWAGTDDATGVASYQLQVSVAGGPYTAVYAGSATAVTKAYAFGSVLAFRVLAVDGAGNPSAWKSLTRKVVGYQAPGSSAIRYSSGWTSVANTRHSGTGARYTTIKGKSATLTFTGREIEYVAPRRATAGYVKVYVDGVYQGRFSLYSSTSKWGQVIFRKTLAYGSHTIKVVNDSVGKRAYLDAFVVLR